MSQRAIFCVDPGGTTGVAWGVFDDRADTVAESMRNRKMSGSATIFHGQPEEVGVMGFQDLVCQHINDLEDLWWPFVGSVGKAVETIDFVVEHFVLTGGVQHRPGVDGIFPAFLVGAILVTFDDEITLQTAGVGMKWHKRKFHESYNTWIVGKEHEREAWAHVAARLHNVLR